MINFRKLKVIEYLDNNKIIVMLNNKKYIRTEKKNIANQNYVKINNREFLV